MADLAAVIARLDSLETTVNAINARVQSMEAASGGGRPAAPPARRRGSADKARAPRTGAAAAYKASSDQPKAPPKRQRQPKPAPKEDGPQQPKGFKKTRRSSTMGGEEKIKARAKQKQNMSPLDRLMAGGKSQEEVLAEIAMKESRDERMQSYRFGSRKLFVMGPTAGSAACPGLPEDISAEVTSELNLEYAYGYNGKDIQMRRNLHCTPTGEIIYHLAACGVVCTPSPYGKPDPPTMKFFMGHHDDDVTCCDFEPKRGWVATGQVDPKDTPGSGKNLPKIYIWDYKTQKKIGLIDDASWGQVKKVAFSPNPKSNYFYSMGGEDTQSISCWDISMLGEFPSEKIQLKKEDMNVAYPIKAQLDTYKEECFGMMVMENCYKKDSCDEIVVFGRRKCSYHFWTEKEVKGKTIVGKKAKMIKLTGVKGGPKKGESAYLCVCRIPGSAQYVIGSPKGFVFLCCGSTAFSAFRAHKGPVGDICVLSPTEIITASFDKTLKVLKLKGPKLTCTSTSAEVGIPGSDFEMAPRCIAWNPKIKRLFIGTKSNQIVWTNLEGTATEMVVDGHDDQVWAICSHPSAPYFCTGGYDNCIKIWDKNLKKNTETFQFPMDVDDNDKPIWRQVGCAGWSEDGDLVAVGTEDSNIWLFKFDKTKKPGTMLSLCDQYLIPPKTKKASSEAPSYVRFNKDNTLLAVAHMDAQTYLFDISDASCGGKGERDLKDPWMRASDPTRYMAMPEVAAPSHLQFSLDGKMLKVFTRDYEISYWKLDKKNRRVKRETYHVDPDLVQFTGDPLIAGWEVQGLYQDCWDGTDLNDAAVGGKDSNLVVSGDDYGWVRLHNYPALDRTKCKGWQAHSAFVVGIEWTGDGDYVMSVGGGDFAILQWRLREAPPESGSL